jgi:hypothetical protein
VLDFSALKLNSGPANSGETTNFVKALQPIAASTRDEYCKNHFGHKLAYLQKETNEMMCEICLT